MPTTFHAIVQAFQSTSLFLRRYITIAKLIAVALLIAGSLGLLWHQSRGVGMWGVPYFYYEWNLAKIPDWLLFGPQGWYPAVSMTIYWVFHTVPIVATSYLIAAILCISALFSIPFIQSTRLRILIGIPALLIFSYEFIVLEIAGALPDLSTTNTVLMNIQFGIDTTVSVYALDILKNTIFVGFLGAIILARPNPKFGLSRHLPLLTISLCIASIAFVQYRHKMGQHPAAYPTPIASAMNLIRALSTELEPKILPAQYSQPFTFQMNKIIVIMDESIRGDYVASPHDGADPTPFLTAQNYFFNFGTTSSAANCSIPSRISFRHLLQQADIKTPIQQLITRPTIWQFAKKAGYKTIHFDAFGSPITLTSGMTQTERNHIDQRIPIMDLPHHMRDITISKDLATLLKEPGKALIFVEKYGTHIPYDNTYPKDRNIFKSDPTKPFNLTDVDQLIKHYKNAINWSVDQFFRELLKAELPEDSLLIYTSDHGQSLSEGGRKLTHCSFSGTMRAGEASVPLLAMSTNLAWSKALSNSAIINQGRTSHFNLPSTLLLAMGHDRTWVANTFEPSLIDPIPHDHKRLVRFGSTFAEFNPVK